MRGAGIVYLAPDNSRLPHDHDGICAGYAGLRLEYALRQICNRSLSYEHPFHATNLLGEGMRDSDALDNNPHVTRSALEDIHGQVYGWALSRCDFDHATAEDLMQQAYVELLSGSARFDNKSTLKTFVFSVVQNLARSRFRRISSRLRLVKRYHRESINEAPRVVEPVDDSVWRAVRALPARQRDIIELVFCRELTVEQAAVVMGVSTGTGRAHYDRAKKALRSRLQHWSESES